MSPTATRTVRAVYDGIRYEHPDKPGRGPLAEHMKGREMLKKPTWPNVRDGILFFSGLAGLAYEVLIRRPPDYGFVPVFGGMIGLPAFLHRDTATIENRDAKSDGDHGPTDNALPGG